LVKGLKPWKIAPGKRPEILLIVFKGRREGLGGVQYPIPFPLSLPHIIPHQTPPPGSNTPTSPRDNAPGNQPGEAIPGPGGRDNAPGIATPGHRKAPFNGGQFLGFEGFGFILFV